MPSPQLNYLRHPITALARARKHLGRYRELRRIAAQARIASRTDPRYSLQAVTDGFLSTLHHKPRENHDDQLILNRIATAYLASTAQELSSPAEYQATAWWQGIRRRNLQPVIRALRERDLETLARLYANFFRDPCSAGLIGVPFGLRKQYFAQPIRPLHAWAYLSDALPRLDHWRSVTDPSLDFKDLAASRVGNPFGLLLDRAFIPVHADYRHYCAQRLGALVEKDKPASIAEIGGGFGGMAYYLLRDFPGIQYIDFDAPESIALTSYYLMKSFPHLNFLLYGEARLAKDTLHAADVVLLPLSALEESPALSVEVTFTSHAMSDLSVPDLEKYLEHITRMTTRYFLFTGLDHKGQEFSENVKQLHPRMSLVERRPSHWHRHKTFADEEVECLYSMNRSCIDRSLTPSAVRHEALSC